MNLLLTNGGRNSSSSEGSDDTLKAPAEKADDIFRSEENYDFKTTHSASTNFYSTSPISASALFHGKGHKNNGHHKPEKECDRSLLCRKRRNSKTFGTPKTMSINPVSSGGKVALVQPNILRRRRKRLVSSGNLDSGYFSPYICSGCYNPYSSMMTPQQCSDLRAPETTQTVCLENSAKHAQSPKASDCSYCSAFTKTIPNHCDYDSDKEDLTDSCDGPSSSSKRTNVTAIRASYNSNAIPIQQSQELSMSSTSYNNNNARDCKKNLFSFDNLLYSKLEKSAQQSTSELGDNKDESFEELDDYGEISDEDGSIISDDASFSDTNSIYDELNPLPDENISPSFPIHRQVFCDIKPILNQNQEASATNLRLNTKSNNLNQSFINKKQDCSIHSYVVADETVSEALPKINFSEEFTNLASTSTPKFPKHYDLIKPMPSKSQRSINRPSTHDSPLHFIDEQNCLSTYDDNIFQTCQISQTSNDDTKQRSVQHLTKPRIEINNKAPNPFIDSRPIKSSSVGGLHLCQPSQSSLYQRRQKSKSPEVSSLLSRPIAKTPSTVLTLDDALAEVSNPSLIPSPLDGSKHSSIPKIDQLPTRRGPIVYQSHPPCTSELPRTSRLEQRPDYCANQEIPIAPSVSAIKSHVPLLLPNPPQKTNLNEARLSRSIAIQPTSSIHHRTRVFSEPIDFDKVRRSAKAATASKVDYAAIGQNLKGIGDDFEVFLNLVSGKKTSPHTLTNANAAPSTSQQNMPSCILLQNQTTNISVKHLITCLVCQILHAYIQN